MDSSLPPEADLHIARAIHGGNPPREFSMRGFRPWWAIDWPEAEAHFVPGAERMTLVDIAPDSRHIQLTDPNLFDYPWLFLQQPAKSAFSRAEAEALREYLDRGGFVLMDDFHGTSDYARFEFFVRQVFPDRPLVDIPVNDVVMRIHYDLNQDTQIPGERHLRLTGSGVEAQMQGPQAWKGVYDDSGNLVLAAHYNMDMGDAWQHADDYYYPAEMTALAYRFGVNYIIYAMTH